jgi:hypothetical protein
LKKYAIQTLAKTIKMAVTPDPLVEITKMLAAPFHMMLNPTKKRAHRSNEICVLWDVYRRTHTPYSTFLALVQDRSTILKI